MRLPKILIYLIVIGILLVPATRESASAIVQSAIIHSGIVNAATDEIRKEAFNYDFVVKDLSGKEVAFKDFRGKVIFINLWATWCGPCRSEMPSIQELYNGIDKEKIAFVMLSLDEVSRIEKVKSYVAQMEFNFPVFMTQGQLTNQLYVETIPTTFIIDKYGYIVAKETGMRNYNTAKFKRYLEELASK
jgi:thiol-disulfide isomerase/thioredoxin